MVAEALTEMGLDGLQGNVQLRILRAAVTREEGRGGGRVSRLLGRRRDALEEIEESV